MIKLASINKWSIYQLDINCAYLNGKLKEDIYMKIPYFGEGYKEPNKIWKLKRSIYGLKQSAKVWNDEITKTICNMGLKQSNLDPCVFFYFIDDILNGVVMIYVDDILIIGENSFIKIVKNEFFNKYKCKDIGFAKYILGVEIIKNDLGNYSLSQKAYIEKMLDRYLDVYSQNNNKIGSPGTIYNKDEVDGEDVNPTLYRSIVGALIHLYRQTRLDITFPANYAVRFSSNPKERHLKMLIKILRYIKGTKELVLSFNEKTNITIYNDASYNDISSNCDSTSGFLLNIGENPISWISKKQPICPLSTTEAELNANVESIKHIKWITDLFKEAKIFKKEIMNIKDFIDNKSCIYQIKNKVINSKNKYYTLRIIFLNQYVKLLKLNIEFIEGTNNLADILTKPFPVNKQKEITNKLLL